ncbi:MAG: SMC-Scp complex subunit ScpB [Bryobacteraceae bacterium]
MDELDVTQLAEERPAVTADDDLKAIIEAIVYVTDEPLSAQQMAAALERPLDVVQRILNELTADYAQPQRGLSIREVAGGYKMATKAEHHESVRAFVKKLTPPLKLSLAALETLAVIAYKQPVTAPEIMEIRGVQGAGVLKTLLDRKLIAEAGRKKVVGQPILYKTTKEFLVQFGLKDLRELPTLKEFEEIGRMSIADDEQAELPLAEGTVTAVEGQTDEGQADEVEADEADAGEAGAYDAAATEAPGEEQTELNAEAPAEPAAESPAETSIETSSEVSAEAPPEPESTENA